LISDLLLVVVSCLVALPGEITVLHLHLQRGLYSYRQFLKNTLIVPCHKLSFIQSCPQEKIEPSAEALQELMYAVTSRESSGRLSISGQSTLRKLKGDLNSAPHP
jgi:hypothetical protein